MWIARDLLSNSSKQAALEVVAVLGPRQVGKTSLLTHIAPSACFLSLDDLQVRQRAQSDPALLIELSNSQSFIFDEFQYAPELLSEIKLRVDSMRRDQQKGQRTPTQTSFFLSGSNQIQIDEALRETLAGRVSLYSLHGLSVHELVKHNPTIPLTDILFCGGFPELYIRPDLNPIEYLNDYISTFVEKDIARSAGIQKIQEFLLVTRLLAARVGALVNNDALAQDSGVAPKTIADWRDVLDRARITMSLPVYSSNLNTRLIKTPKVFFLDSGLLLRLQGHLERLTILSTPHAGHVFENLVIAEAAKTRDHFKRAWNLSYWRTKDQEEIDLIVESGSRRLFIEAKLAIQSVRPIEFSSSLKKTFTGALEGCVVTPAGTKEKINSATTRVPISEFAEFLLERLG